MPLIDIDVPEQLPPEIQTLLDDPEALIEAVLDDVSESALLKWRTLASQQLHTSKADYLDALQPIETRPGERVLSLVGWLAEAVETGLESYDLKVVLLRNAKRRSAAGHRYQAIPFRHATPGASTGQAGVQMGARYGPVHKQSLATPGALSQGAAAVLGKKVYSFAKKLRGNKRLAPGTGGAKRLAAWHTTDLYAGMTKRSQKRPGGKRQTAGYMTFRMVSENPAIANVQDKWLHPGIQGRHLADQVADHAAALVTPAIQMAVSKAIGG